MHIYIYIYIYIYLFILVFKNVFLVENPFIYYQDSLANTERAGLRHLGRERDSCYTLRDEWVWKVRGQFGLGWCPRRVGVGGWIRERKASL